MRLLRPTFPQGIEAIGILNAIVQKIAEEKEWQALDARVVYRFNIALYQFCRPQLPTVPTSQLLFDIPQNEIEVAYWTDIQRFTGGVPHVPHVQNPGSHYISLPPDDGYFNIHINRTQQERIDPPPPPREPHRPKKKFRPFGSQNREFPNNQSFKHPDNEGGNIGTYSYRSRKIVTAQAGLYSSVLAARKMTRKVGKGAIKRETILERDDDTALLQADMVTNVLRTIVRDMSFMRYSALHITNIALRLANQYLDQQRKDEFYSLFFNKQLNQLLWRDILNSATKYDVRMGVADRTRWLATPVAAGVFNLLNQDGTLNQPKAFLKAYPNDIYFDKLYGSMSKLGFARNVLMVARKIWYHEFGTMINMVPSSKYMGQLITESANDLNKDFRANVIRNFKSRYASYLTQRLKQVAQVPLGWPNTEEFVAIVVDATNNDQEEDVQGPGIDDNNRQAIMDFVQKMRMRYIDGDIIFDNNSCRMELVKISTTPPQWPEDVDNFVKYLFYMIWDYQLYDGEETVDNDENQDFLNTVELVQGLPADTQQDIQDFIQDEIEVRVVLRI